MSFFCDFLKEISFNDMLNCVGVSLVLHKGVMIVGEIKLTNFSETKIQFKAFNEDLVICGCNLKIKSISKGEIIVEGDVVWVGCENAE